MSTKFFEQLFVQTVLGFTCIVSASTMCTWTIDFVDNTRHRILTTMIGLHSSVSQLHSKQYTRGFTVCQYLDKKTRPCDRADLGSLLPGSGDSIKE